MDSPNKTWSLKVFGKPVEIDTTNSIDEEVNLPVILDNDNASNFVDMLSKMGACYGNTKYEDVVSSRVSENLKEPFPDQSGDGMSLLFIS